MNDQAQTDEVLKGYKAFKPNEAVKDTDCQWRRNLGPNAQQAAPHRAVPCCGRSAIEVWTRNYEAAEKAALAIEKRFQQLHVTVFDAKERQHTLIEQPRVAVASNKNRSRERNAVERRKAVIAGGKH